MTDLRQAAQQALEAWDSTVLPVANDGMMQERMEILRETLEQPEQGPVASIYISQSGEREFDDWKCKLPIGRNLLYTTPPAAQPAPTVQEPWNPSDTAHRPGGLPQDFIAHEVESFGDWSEWVSPDPEKYFMKCCDCGLVHEMQFKVAKYAEGDECEFVTDANLQAVFRARRATPPAAQRKWQGLTDEDVNRESAMIASKMKLAFHAGMYVAQQVLKERNNG